MCAACERQRQPAGNRLRRGGVRFAYQSGGDAAAEHQESETARQKGLSQRSL